jgi:hypothetical protein
MGRYVVGSKVAVGIGTGEVKAQVVAVLPDELEARLLRPMPQYRIAITEDAPWFDVQKGDEMDVPEWQLSPRR